MGNRLSSMGIDIDQGDRAARTALMICANSGNSYAVRILLDHGANVEIVAFEGVTALHFAAEAGHPAVTKMLVDAGANTEAADSLGCTALHKAAFAHHAQVVRTLVEAGANVNSRDNHGGTPLYCASMDGDVDVTRELLLANADAQLGGSILPIDMAAGCGHSQMVRELLRQRGIKGCGGESHGVNALHAAAQHNQLGILTMLTEAGAVDSGTALIGAAERGHEGPVKFLLQEHLRKTPRRGAYVKNTRDDPFGRIPLRRSVVEACRACAPRVVRMLVDAGVDTVSPVPITKKRGGYGPLTSDSTLLDFTARNIRQRNAEGKFATAEQLGKMEAIRRLLLRVRAARAASWLWCRGAPPAARAEEGAREGSATSAPLGGVMPALRRRAARRGMLLAPLFRHSQKP
eukprot:g11280.t1